MYDLSLKDQDLQVTSKGEIVLATTKKELAAQWVSIRLKTILSEWFLDVDQGINWVGILSARNNKDTVDLTIISTITSTKYIKRLRTYKSSIDVGSHKYFVQFSADVEDGTILDFEQELF